MRPYSFMWSIIASFSQSSTILRRLQLIMKDKKTSTDLQLTHIEVHIFLKLVGIFLDPFHQFLIFFFFFFWGGKNNVDAKVIFLKHVGKNNFYNGKILFTLSPKYTRFLVVPEMGVIFYLIPPYRRISINNSIKSL